jgi:DnaJ family protein C protein 7
VHGCPYALPSSERGEDGNDANASAASKNAQMEQAVKLLREAVRLDPDAGESCRALKGAIKSQRLLLSARESVATRKFEAALEQYVPCCLLSRACCIAHSDRVGELLCRQHSFVCSASLMSSATRTRLPDSLRYTECLQHADAPKMCPLHAVLLAERATCHLRLKHHQECLKDCAGALYAQDDNKAAWLTRGSALHALGRHEEALEDMRKLAEMCGSDTVVQHRLEKADFEVRKRKRADYYEVLQVKKVSTEIELKAAYKMRALEWHPDKHVDKPKDEQKAAEERFKAIGEALEVLTDPMKRQLYDEGYDKSAIDERVSRAQRAAREDGRGHHHH